jgi:hypothetical protein
MPAKHTSRWAKNCNNNWKEITVTVENIYSETLFHRQCDITFEARNVGTTYRIIWGNLSRLPKEKF